MQLAGLLILLFGLLVCLGATVWSLFEIFSLDHEIVLEDLWRLCPKTLLTGFLGLGLGLLGGGLLLYSVF